MIWVGYCLLYIEANTGFTLTQQILKFEFIFSDKCCDSDFTLSILKCYWFHFVNSEMILVSFCLLYSETGFIYNEGKIGFTLFAIMWYWNVFSFLLLYWLHVYGVYYRNDAIISVYYKSVHSMDKKYIVINFNCAMN